MIRQPIVFLILFPILCWCAAFLPPPNYGFIVPIYPVNNITHVYNTSLYNSVRNETYNQGCKSNAINSSQSHHLFQGCVREGDRVIFNQQFAKPPRWWSTREKIIDFPPEAPGVVPPIITGIRIFDNKYDGTGGFASILTGGIGYRYTRIRIYTKSTRRGFDFTVKIYTR